MTSNDPWTDNASRAHNKRLTSEARKAFRIVRNDGGRIARKRKKFVNRVERANYAAILDSVFRSLVAEALAEERTK